MRAMSSASLTLAEGNVTSSSQDNIQMIALNVNPVWAPIWRMYSDPHVHVFVGLFELCSLNCLWYEVCSLLVFFCTLFFILQNLCCVDRDPLYAFFSFFFLVAKRGSIVLCNPLLIKWFYTDRCWVFRIEVLIWAFFFPVGPFRKFS